MPEKVRVGIVGCGAISHQYLTNIPKFPIFQVVALADLIRERCESRAKEFNLGGVKIRTTEQMMKDDSVEVILNLTWPKAHVPVGAQAVGGGKHHFSEKPFGINFKEGKKLCERQGQRDKNPVRPACGDACEPAIWNAG